MLLNRLNKKNPKNKPPQKPQPFPSKNQTKPLTKQKIPLKTPTKTIARRGSADGMSITKETVFWTLPLVILSVSQNHYLQGMWVHLSLYL